LIYTKTITESSGGSAASPSQYRMSVTDGLIYQVNILLPPGSSGLLRVAVKDGAYSLWPSEPGEWFFGDNILISFPDKYIIASAPHELFIWAYNLDTAYDHKFQIQLGQVSDPMLIQSFLPSIQMQDFTAQMAELIASQDQSRAAQRDRAIIAAGEMEGVE